MHTRNVQKEIKEVLKEVAAELDMDYKIVEDIYYHQFYYIAEQISKGEKNNAGTFLVCIFHIIINFLNIKYNIFYVSTSIYYL